MSLARTPAPRTLSIALLSLALLLVGCGGTTAATPGSASGTSTGATSTASATGTSSRAGAAVGAVRAETAVGSVPDEATVGMLPVGYNRLRILSPTLLELIYVNTKLPASDPTQWSFVSGGTLALPPATAFVVTVDGRSVGVQAMGFRRRALYAPVKSGRDLRIGNSLYLQLASAVADGATVQVTNPDASVWPASQAWVAKADPMRWSPAVHANHEGYLPAMPKKAMVGYYLGSLGELPVPTSVFRVVDDAGATVFSGPLSLRAEQGSTTVPTPYQQVYQADFSALQAPGRYRLLVPGLGTSFPFVIDDAVAANFTRTYALGMYHKRCGSDNALPFTRFLHGVCHTGLVQVPTMAAEFATTNGFLSGIGTSVGYQTAPALTSVATALYAFVGTAPFDARGAHHDAGDYSRYTVNNAMLVHYLVFAVDNLPGVAALDNLGLPESGDGESDLLQMARWEADYLCRIQDADGGFGYQTYPRDVRYESDVLPDSTKYQPQVIWPKSTQATAAAVAALAELGTSPVLRAKHPDDAARYLERAKAGWAFLGQAWAKHGRQGAFQLITLDRFHDLDFIAWAEVEMYLATGDPGIHRMVLQDLKPGDRSQMVWGWWRLCDGYGCAVRGYAFGARSGRVGATALDPTLLAACEDELDRGGKDQVAHAAASAYNVSYPTVDKRWGNAAWFSATDHAFDIVVAHRLRPSPAYLDALVGNANYENGTNPVNMGYVTGLGWKRPWDIVDQYAANDRRRLPPSGIGLGSIAASHYWTSLYGSELSAINFPAVGSEPMYDRWSDSWNVYREITTRLQARGLCAMAFLMAKTPQAAQAWRAAPATLSLSGTPALGQAVTATLSVPGQDLSTAARIVWEASNTEPVLGGTTFSCTPSLAGPGFIEAEVQWPDGRRAFAVAELNVPPAGGATGPATLAVSFRYALNGPITGLSGGNVALSCYGLTCRVPYNQATINPLTPYASLVVGQGVSVRVTPFTGACTALGHNGYEVTLSSPLGPLVVPKQTLSDATQQQIRVLCKLKGSNEVVVKSMYDAFLISGAQIVGLAP